MSRRGAHRLGDPADDADPAMTPAAVAVLAVLVTGLVCLLGRGIVTHDWWVTSLCSATLTVSAIWEWWRRR